MGAQNKEKVSFASADGHQLAGILDRPEGKARAYAIFAHCFTCSKHNAAAVRISQGLTKQAIAVLRFDFTGLGSSQGDFSDTTFSSNIQDLIQASDFLSDNYEAPKLLIGHSLGGSAVLVAGSKIAAVKAIVAINAPYDPVHVKHLLREDIAQIEAQGKATVLIGQRPFVVKKDFIDDLSQHAMDVCLKELGKPVLIMHASNDTIVPIENGYKIFEAAQNVKSFIELDDADHMLSKPQHAEYVAKMIARWAGDYL